MPYRIDVFAQGEYYHVYNRGLLKQTIFFGEGDYKRFIEKLALQLDEKEFRLHAYCVMSNHFHLLLEQFGNETVTTFMNSIQGSYGRYFNLKYKKKGNVFEGRFRVKRVANDTQLVQLSKYIHRNPIEARMVKRLIDYPWSSYRTYLSEVGEVFVTTNEVLGLFSSRNREKDYQCFVEERFIPEEVLRMADELIDIEVD